MKTIKMVRMPTTKTVMVPLISVAVTIVTINLAGCSAQYHSSQAQGAVQGNQLTLGTVQREIKVGMSSADVITALGSPNVVTTDDQRREVWVYDKFATDVAYSKGGWTVLFMGQSAGAASASQRTITIVVKFDDDKKVRDFAYHTSRF